MTIASLTSMELANNLSFLYKSVLGIIKRDPEIDHKVLHEQSLVSGYLLSDILSTLHTEPAKTYQSANTQDRRVKVQISVCSFIPKKNLNT